MKGEKLTELELQLLREINGDLPASPWGAWVGACAEALQEMGLIDRAWKITDAGRQHPQMQEAPVGKVPFA